MCSILLYMKTRVTFRLDPVLATALRELPNQTDFVERALRSALGRTCPLCEGTGRISLPWVRVSNFRVAKLPALDRGSALQLRGVVQLARRLAATALDLSVGQRSRELGFAVLREGDVLVRGTFSSTGTSLAPS